MTQQDLTPLDPTVPPPQGFGLRDLWRLVAWGLAAGGALMLAVYATTTPTGHQRFAVAIAEAGEIAMPTGIQPPRPLDAKEGRRLADAVKALIVDRERLLTRVATLERSLDDVTASITRVEKVQSEPPAPPQPTPGASAAVAPPAAEEVTSSVTPRVETAVPAEAAEPGPAAETPLAEPAPLAAKAAGAKAEFGLDLGGARTIEGMRALWNNAKRRHGTMLDGLRPIVHLRERGRPAAVEMRLVVGPIPNAATAARMCATFAAAGAVCQPAPFDGQRLAVR